MDISKLNEEDINHLLQTEPHKIIKAFEDVGRSFEDVKKQLDLGRRTTKSFFPEMTDREVEATEFLFWIAYTAERLIRDLITEVETKAGARKEAISIIVDRLHFGDKISIISDLYKNGGKDEFVKILWKINTLRNAVAHGKFSELVYDGFHLSDLKGQLKLIIDLKDGALGGK